MHSAHKTTRPSIFSTSAAENDEEEVRMGLLGPSDGHAPSPDDLEEEDSEDDVLKEKLEAHSGLTPKDKRAMALLVVLYTIQGIPMGLTSGSVPFLLRDRLAYSQLGTFSLASLPYSFKLLHAPVVDAVFSSRFGRRKSWIVPIQMVMGSLMIWMGNNTPVLIETAHPPVNYLTLLFGLLTLLAATQDVAVDGWALTLLSQENLSYASTAQTLGLNMGFFMSYTVFLALNSADFANKYIRKTPVDVGLISLGGYLQFWGLASLGVSIFLLIFKKEGSAVKDDEDLNLITVYKSMWSVIKLRPVLLLCALNLLCSVVSTADDAVTGLKMVEKGLKRENLAMIALFDFPFQLIGGWMAAAWCAGDKPLRPWLYSYWGKLGFAIVWMVVVWAFPKPPIEGGFFVLLTVLSIASGFAGTVQFVGICAFHTRVADPLIGGTYMTLLNTIGNLGSAWPKFFVLKGVDAFTIAKCELEATLRANATLAVVAGTECVSETGRALCKDSGGTCLIERDGYYYMSTLCVAVGLVLFLAFIRPTAQHLQALPPQRWRVAPTT